MKTRLSISVALLLFSLLGLGFWIKYTMDAQQRYNEAMDDVWEAREELAQAYAALPYSLEWIDNDIEAQNYDADCTEWLKMRVRQLRD